MRWPRKPVLLLVWQTAAELAEQCEMVGLVTRANARAAGAGAATVSVRAMATSHDPLVMQREGELYRLERVECRVEKAFNRPRTATRFEACIHVALRSFLAHPKA